MAGVAVSVTSVDAQAVMLALRDQMTAELGRLHLDLALARTEVTALRNALGDAEASLAAARAQLAEHAAVEAAEVAAAGGDGEALTGTVVNGSNGRRRQG